MTTLTGRVAVLSSNPETVFEEYSMNNDTAGSTIMSVLFGVAQHDDDLRRKQLERFACQYAQPLVNYLIRKNWAIADEARDLVQEFWLDKLIEPDPSVNLVALYLQSQWRQTSREENSFRKYLLRSLSNFYIDYTRRKRPVIGIEGVEQIASEADYQTFDAVWANSLLRTIVTRVRDECLVNDQQLMWQLFCRQIVLPKLTGNGPPGYALLASEFGFSDARSAGNAVRTVIRKFQSHLKNCVRDYLPINSIGKSDEMVDEEFSEIVKILSKPGLLEREMFEDIIVTKDSQLGPDESFFMNNVASTHNLLVDPQESLYASDDDIAHRWLQIRSNSIAQWLGTECEDSEECKQSNFSDLAHGRFLSEDTLLNIRNTAKQLAKVTGDEPQLLLATIYLLAIASCFQHHSKLLTSDPAKKIRLRVDQIIHMKWLDNGTREYLTTFAAALSKQ